MLILCHKNTFGSNATIAKNELPIVSFKYDSSTPVNVLLSERVYPAATKASILSFLNLNISLPNSILIVPE
jgi:hypothetical protein